MNEVKVSIVMPTYNAAQYIGSAIESVQAQELAEWELIVINDGSTDATAAIIDEYARRDSRIVPIHQLNMGVSATRQKGVIMAHGQYLIHVDSDDWLEPDYLSSMYKEAVSHDADMVWCDICVNDSGKWSFRCAENPDAMIRCILEQKIWGSLCNRLIRSSICQSVNIHFPPQCSMWEDMAFVVQCLTQCKHIVYVPKALYHYRQVSSSLVHSQSDKDISAEYRKAIDCIEHFFDENGIADNYRAELRVLQLFALRDFIDDKRFVSYDKFLHTYPEAIAHIWEYDFPLRLKLSAWLLQHNISWAVPIVCKIDAILRRLGLSKQI